ncbi:hypothetical protein PV327_007326 [Microctonus hyperodae]|uniref:DNA mismatch repair protein S5 domain-containing protein n=1 Tax=Microctonus hyperodae TaxID=165561 RepID=A0AA39F686_MICHY|nr:hypothetical protein PV327_007326 [Microctonus hyperodae]
MAITALDKITVKKLTTAQIVTSVFSAVKELVENALDAAATNIDVILEDQGLSFIEVRDNASGISKSDSLFIALPAYTSKLSNFNGLESLITYGFRGEALNALCQVSNVKIITRTEKDDAARCYTMNHDGKIERTELCARSIGTTIQVFSFMKMIPVRRKIISSKKCANQNVEEIECLLQDFGICHPNIRINYKVDGVNLFTKLPTDTIRESLINIFNKKFVSCYEFLSFNDLDINIELIIPKIDLTDLSSICQKIHARIYINNRPVLYNKFEKLVNSLLSKHFYEIMPGKKKPIFFLIIKVLPSNVDVNLDPNKTKVLLKNVSRILELVEKLLLNYYKISRTNEVISTPILINESLVPFMNNSDSNDETMSINLPPRKKRKINNNKPESITNKSEAKANMENNENDNEVKNKSTITKTNEEKEKETVDQLPEVDLGPDFSTQYITNIPALDSKNVQSVVTKFEQAMAQSETSNIPTTTTELQIQLTESQWSKGHCKILKGGTDVIVLSSSNVHLKKKKEINDSHTNPNTKGFLKFSEKMGKQIREKHREMDFVTMATLIASKWKQLEREEREYYRKLGRQDILVDQKLNSSGDKKRSLKKDPKILENNKKKMQEMIHKMENLNRKEDDWMRESVKENANNHNAKIRNVRNWELDKKKLINSHQNTCNNKDKRNVIIGPLESNIWIVRTNSQIWALNLNYLFDALNLNEQERIKFERNHEMIELYFRRGLYETDNMDFMYPFYII